MSIGAGDRLGCRAPPGGTLTICLRDQHVYELRCVTQTLLSLGPSSRHCNRMPYEAPEGWRERIDEPDDEQTPLKVTFHLRRDCEQIQRPESLVAVDRPYAATRCRTCAPSE
jgi:hypothetical protein